MAKLKLGITLSVETVANLEKLCRQNGLTKSQAIALAVNTYVNEKIVTKGESDEGK